MFYVLLVIVIILYLLYRYANSTYGYWKKLNVVYQPPTTFFGNLKESIFMTKCLGEIYYEAYNTYKDVPYIGMFQMRKPVILIRDADLVKDIMIQNFHKFEKNSIEIDEKVDPIASKNPFLQYGARWKNTRSQLGNCFSSGKIKLMFPLLYESSKSLTRYLSDECKIPNNPINAKDMAAKYTTDTVATCAFGLESKAFEDPDSEFIKMGQQIFQPTFSLNVKLLLLMIFPGSSKILKLKFFPDNAVNYFRGIIKETLRYRRENNIVRNDFLDIVTQLKFTSGEYECGDDNVTSYAISFFGDGFETTSITLSFALYELAANPTAQQKLREEIESVLKRNDGILTYQAVQDMNYLDCVLSEALRLHPPGLFLSKTCTESYTLPPCIKGGNELQIERGMTVILPAYGLHRDPKYFPNPELFDPDRFSEANKSNIPKGAYLPFGAGPRACVAMRFAVIQVKVAIIAVVKEFDICVNKKTKEPLEIDPKYFMLLAKGGLWLEYHKRNN